MKISNTPLEFQNFLCGKLLLKSNENIDFKGNFDFHRNISILLKLILHLNGFNVEYKRCLFDIEKIKIQFLNMSNETAILCSIGDISNKDVSDSKYFKPSLEDLSMEIFKLLMNVFDNSKEGIQFLLGESSEEIFRNYYQPN